jgi:hypothetical protein
MADILTEWEQSLTLKTVTTTTVDFEPQQTVTPEPIRGVVQVAKPQELNADQVDWSLRYIKVHSKSLINVGQYVEYKGTNYRVITPSNWQDYGYSEVVAEEVKESLT